MPLHSQSNRALLRPIRVSSCVIKPSADKEPIYGYPVGKEVTRPQYLPKGVVLAGELFD